MSDLIIDERHDVIPALSVGNFQATPTGLVIAGDPSYDTWQEYGKGLQVVGQSLDWIIGDWLAHGEQRFADRYTQAIELTGLGHRRLINLCYISKAVPMSRRRYQLEHSKYAAVASLPEKEQTAWLESAEKEDWTRAELRQRIRDTGTPEVNDAEDREICLNIIMGAQWRTFRTQSLRAIGRIVLAEQNSGG